MAAWLTERPERRIVVIGNAGGGKSTLARLIAESGDLPYIEVDRLLWHDGWRPADSERYAAAHEQALSGSSWVMDGLGRKESIPARLARSTDIILIDLPLWAHFWLAAERQIAWHRGEIEHPPAGSSSAPPTELLFRTIWDVDQAWMPELRQQIEQAEADGRKAVIRIDTLKQLDALTDQIKTGP